jgi:hypothetical protein
MNLIGSLTTCIANLMRSVDYACMSARSSCYVLVIKLIDQVKLMAKGVKTTFFNVKKFTNPMNSVDGLLLNCARGCLYETS